MKFKLIGAVSAAVALLTSAAFAEDYPSKTIEVVTHAGNGGGTDVTTRMMMLRARRALKQDMVIVNKKGGGGAAALEYYKTVAADGYTILTFTVGHAAVMAKGQGGMKIDELRPIARGTDDPQILITKCVSYASAGFCRQTKRGRNNLWCHPPWQYRRCLCLYVCQKRRHENTKNAAL